MVAEIERILQALDDKDKKILHCARAEFAKYGYYNANMDRIALSAGLGKGTLYRRFINKQILFFVTIQAGQRELNARLGELDPNLPLRQQIEAYLKSATGYIVENIDLLKLAMHEHSKVLEGLEHDDLRSLGHSMHETQTDFWRYIVARAVEQNLCAPDLDQNVVVSMLTGMLRAIYAEIFVSGGSSSVVNEEKIIQRNEVFVRVLFDGLFHEIK